MGDKKLQGFTIVEVMLFLAVTGLVMAVFLTGIGTSLNRERYRDAAASFHDYIQGQYDLVANVNNNRNYDEVCTSTGVVIDSSAALTAGRGTSDCMIMGRILHASSDGQTVTSSQVYATQDTLAGDTDEEILTDAQMVSGPAADEYIVEWGAKLVQPAPSNALPSNFSILIVRMPNSGVIRTFTSQSADLSPEEMISQAIPVGGFKVCVDSNGLVSAASLPVGVNIARNTSNSAGITFVSEGDC